jgi:sugar lactone lactonase YvrE
MNLTCVRRTAYGVAAVVLAAVGQDQTVYAQVAETRASVEVTTVTDTLPGAVGGLTVDRLGYVYVADFGERVWKVSPFGEVTELATDLYGASGNAVDSHGALFQANFFGNTISRISRDGASEIFVTGLNGPVGISIDSANNLYVCNCAGNSISKVTSDGTVSEFASGDHFNCPNGITRDTDDNLYVVNFSDGRLLKITPNGQAAQLAIIPGGGNGHVTFAAGELYVTGFRSNRVYRVTLGGDVTTVAGTGAFSATDGPGPQATFATPNGIAYDAVRDRLYTNDYLIPFPQRRFVPPRSVVRQIRFPTLTESFNAAYEAGGIDAAVAAHNAYRESRPGRFTELEVNALGYQVMSAGNVQDAIAVFKLNVEAYPNSFNVYDSLAEGYKVAGERDLAIEFYEKSLELNPANTNAVSMLEELGAR